MNLCCDSSPFPTPLKMGLPSFLTVSLLFASSLLMFSFNYYYCLLFKFISNFIFMTFELSWFIQPIFYQRILTANQSRWRFWLTAGARCAVRGEAGGQSERGNCTRDRTVRGRGSAMARLYLSLRSHDAEVGCLQSATGPNGPWSSAASVPGRFGKLHCLHRHGYHHHNTEACRDLCNISLNEHLVVGRCTAYGWWHFSLDKSELPYFAGRNAPEYIHPLALLRCTRPRPS